MSTFTASRKILDHPEIPSELSLASAVSRLGNPYRTYDDGFGPLWVYVESLGPLGVVRAQSWEGAYEIVEDTIMSDADPSDPDTYATSYNPNAEPGELAEGYHYRPNGAPTVNGLSSYIAAEDLNGSALYRLDAETAQRLEISVNLERL